jgi:putative aldouronate transport system substrate-binding protein
MQRKNHFKPLSIILSSVIVTALLAGCTSSKDATKETTVPSASVSATPVVSIAAKDPNELEWKADTSPFTFSQYFYGTWATMYLWKDQFNMKNITAKTGVTINRILATGKDDDYLNTLIASNDLPDSMMLDWNSPAVTKLINSGMVYSMTELIDKYAPKFWNILDKEMVQYHSIDGKLWYLPNFYQTKENVADSPPPVGIRPWFVRKDIYEAIGKPKLETPDDLVAAMKLSKQKYPDIYPVGLEVFDVNSNGFKGSRSMDYLLYSYSPDLEKERIKDDKQTLEYPMKNAGFKEAFRFLNRLNTEGLFDPQLLIYKQEQYEEKLYGAKYFMPSQFMNDLYSKFNPKIESTLGKDKTYQSIGALKVEGKDPKYPVPRGMGWQAFLISKKAKNPERILKFAEYAWSDEGQLDDRFGKEGESYTMVDGLPEFKPDVIDLKNKDSAGFDTKWGFEEGTLLWRAGSLWDKATTRSFIKNQPDQYATAKSLSQYNFDSFALGIDNIEPEGSTPEGVINAKVKDIWNKTIPKIVLAKTNAEFDTFYNDFLAQIDKVGAEKVEKVMYERHIIDLKKKGLAK